MVLPDVLRGWGLRRIVAGGPDERTVDPADDWYDVLTGVFRLDVTDVDAPARAELWSRVHSVHYEWEAAGRR